MEYNPDTLPTASDPAGQCARCGRISNFQVLAVTPITRLADDRGRGRTVEQVAVLQCMGCHENSAALEAEINDQYGMQGVLWWPTHDLGLTADSAGVPQDVVDAYSEGVRCISVHAPNAAAAMLRTTIAHIVMNKGSEEAKAKRDLKAKINQMALEGTLWNGFGDAAHHVRELGNAGAHGEAFEPVSMEQATDLQNFVKELINFIYIQPHKRAQALRPTRRSPRQADAAGVTGTTPQGGAAQP